MSKYIVTYKTPSAPNSCMIIFGTYDDIKEAEQAVKNIKSLNVEAFIYKKV